MVTANMEEEWQKYKQSGNDLFRANKFEEAHKVDVLTFIKIIKFSYLLLHI